MSDVSSTRWRPPKVVRSIAVGIVRRDDQILLMAVRDDSGSIKGWRPIGGGIEFGEPAADALKREFMEELGTEIRDPRLLCVLENIYTHHGAPGHEIVFVLEARFAEASNYRTERYAFVDSGVRNDVRWVECASLRSGEQQLFPTGLIRHLDATG